MYPKTLCGLLRFQVKHGKTGYDFVWDTRFSKYGDHITVAAQSAGNYFAVTDDSAWQQQYPSLSNLIVSDDGKNVAAVVQSVLFITADIFAFQQGCYTPAVNGKSGIIILSMFLK